MRIQTFTCNPIQENTYLLWDEDTLEAAIIDAGMYSEREKERVSSFMAEHKLRLRLALQTHMHFDHILGLPYIYSQFGIKPVCHQLDQQVYYAMPDMAPIFGIQLTEALPPVERLLRDGDTLQLGRHTIQVIHTPGHTPGGVCYHIEEKKVLFTGDTIFQGSVGRTDFPLGSMEDEIKSIRGKILPLPEETMLFPGHGPQTDLKSEKYNNIYF